MELLLELNHGRNKIIRKVLIVSIAEVHFMSEKYICKGADDLHAYIVSPKTSDDFC